MPTWRCGRLPRARYGPIRCRVRQRPMGRSRTHPSTSQPIAPTLGQRAGNAYRQHQRRFIQDGRGASLSRPQQALTDQPSSESLPVVFPCGRNQSRYRRASIENLNLASATNLTQVAREVRLQVRNGYRGHDGYDSPQFQVVQVTLPVLPRAQPYSSATDRGRRSPSCFRVSNSDQRSTASSRVALAVSSPSRTGRTASKGRA